MAMSHKEIQALAASIISDKYLTIEETAQKFGMSRATIQRLMNKQKIPFTRATGVPRFPDRVLELWARTPERIVQEWFSGEEVNNGEIKNVNSNKTREIGRSLFLQGRKRRKA